MELCHLELELGGYNNEVAALQSDCLTEWPPYRVTALQSGRLTEWPPYRVAALQSGRLTEWPPYRVATLQSGRLTEWPPYRVTTILRFHCIVLLYMYIDFLGWCAFMAYFTCSYRRIPTVIY